MGHCRPVITRGTEGIGRTSTNSIKVMNKEITDPKQTEQKPDGQKKSYKRPELKKHGKLKSTASQTVSTYTYTYIT